MSDSHTQQPNHLPDGDILIHAGDWSNRGSMSDLLKFCDFIKSVSLKYRNIIVIAGNHDWCAQNTPQVTQDCIEKAGAVYLNDSGITLEGIKIWGSPVTPWFFDWAFNKNRGDQIQQHWDLIPDDTQVLVTHGPPYGIGDELSKRGSEPGAHVGCSNLMTTIDDRLKNLKLHVFGHIHEGCGVYCKNDVTYVNASILDDRYRQVNKPTIIELEF
jgi:Icc-related predicted phosphoesterase